MRRTVSTPGRAARIATLTLAAAVAMTVVAVAPARGAQRPAGDPLQVSDPVVAPSSAPLPASRDAYDATPSHYYIWDGTTLPYRGPRDRWGVVLTQLGGSDGPIVYNPVAVAEWGIHAYENYLHTNDARERAEFYVQARSLRRSMDARGRLPYRYVHPTRHIRAPWYSAMAQGLAISVFTRAYMDSGDRGWLAAADRASWPFGREIRRGGVVLEGGSWLEEYPDGHHVLNGSIFAAWGLYDLMRVTGHTSLNTGPASTLPQRVWTRFIRNVAAHLPQYESRGAILYELGTAHFSGITYYDLHLRQLRAMAQLTGDARFEECRVRWSSGFRAYPGPAIQVTTSRAMVAGRRAVYGRVRFLYRDFYGRRPVVTIRRLLANGASVRVATLPVRYSPKGDSAVFTWKAPVARRSVTYRLTIPNQPRTADARFDYPQRSSATFTIAGSRRR